MKIKLITAPRFKEHLSVEMELPIPNLGMAQIASFFSSIGCQVSVDDLDIKISNNKEAYLCYLKLRKNINDVEIKDYIINNKENKNIDLLISQLVELIGNLEYDLFGFSISDNSALMQAILIAYYLKKQGNKIIFGGGALSSKEMLINYVSDEIFIDRDPELKIIDFLKNTFNLNINVSSFNPIPKMKPNLDGYPFSCFINLSKIEANKYHFSNPGNIFFIPYQWNWYCPHQCSFCSNSLLEKPLKPVQKQINEVIEEINELKIKHNSKFFFMLNEYSHVKRNYSINLFEKMNTLDIIWCGSCRCDISINLIDQMHKSGNRFMGFGFESGSKKVLKDMNKNFDLIKFEKILEKNSELGIWNALYVIVGFPTETIMDFKESFNYIYRNIENIDILYVSKYYLSPSDVKENSGKYGIKVEKPFKKNPFGYYNDMSYSKLSGQTWEQIQEAINQRHYQIYKLFYLIKGIPEFYYRGSVYYVMYLLSEYSDKEEILSIMKRHYHENFNEGLKTIKIIDISKPNEKRTCKKLSYERFEYLLQERRSEIKKVIFKGGEPTLNEDLLRMIKLCHKLSIEPIIETDAIKLSNENYCRDLMRSGLKTIYLKLYGHNSLLHESVTGITGSFEDSLLGINIWKKNGGKVEVKTNIDYKNYPNLFELTRLMYNLEYPDLIS